MTSKHVWECFILAPIFFLEISRSESWKWNLSEFSQCHGYGIMVSRIKMNGFLVFFFYCSSSMLIFNVSFLSFFKLAKFDLLLWDLWRVRNSCFSGYFALRQNENISLHLHFSVIFWSFSFLYLRFGAYLIVAVDLKFILLKRFFFLSYFFFVFLP